MKNIFIFASMFSAVSFSVSANNLNSLQSPHIFPDLYGEEYQVFLKNKEDEKFSSLSEDQKSDPIKKILELGARNLDWLKHINTNRETPLSFSTPENRRVYPVESPSVYNKQTVIQEYKQLLDKMPAVMKSVLIYGQKFTNEVPLEEDKYLHYALLIDYVYQGASRWKIMEEYIPYLRSMRKEDVRGYLTLSKIKHLEDKLANFYKISSDEQSLIQTALLRICYNTEENDAKCARLFSKSISQNAGNALPFYAKYIDASKHNYADRFVIPSYAVRSDIVWTGENENLATIPFLDVEEKYKPLLHHIELEWRWQDWQLALNYVSEGDDVPRLEFEAGTTPHVDELGGNQIVMDANTPLDEWDVQWTIRHEFGHVLGFEDCYMEFYDDSVGAIVNYQLDVTNLMCSRKGKFQEKHFNEMKKYYFKN